MTEALILCAGKGERIKNITKDRIPKPMIRINGKPFLWYLIQQLKIFGIKDIVLHVGHKKEKIIEYFKDGSKFNINIKYSIVDKPVGTGGGIKISLPFLKKDTFFVLNGDSIFLINLKEMYNYHQFNGAEITISLKWINNKERYGSVTVDNRNRIINFMEKLEREGGFINAGIYLINRKLLEGIPSEFISFEREMLPYAIKISRKVFGFIEDSYFVDIGTPEGLFNATQELPDRFYGYINSL